MKSKYLTWRTISNILTVASLVALIPSFTIGFTDSAVQLGYLITLSSLIVLTVISLFLTIRFKNKIRPEDSSQAIQSSKKATRYTAYGIFAVIIVILLISVWNSFK